MIGLPFQNNTHFGYGPDDDVQNVLNIQPVWPFRVSPEWNLITRTILPVVDQPDLTLQVKVAPGVVEDVNVDGAFGLGGLERRPMDDPDRRRHREDLPRRQAADECAGQRV